MAASTRDQALAFVEGLLKSPKIRAHLEAVLGWGRLPEETGWWDSQNPEELDRCEELAIYLEETGALLRGTLAGRSRQGSIPGLEDLRVRPGVPSSVTLGPVEFKRAEELAEELQGDVDARHANGDPVTIGRPRKKK